MTRPELKDAVLRILSAIAPEADLSHLKPDVPFRDQLDVDSMDLLNFFVAIDKDLHVDIPEADYSKVASLDDCIDYLQARVATRT